MRRTQTSAPELNIPVTLNALNPKFETARGEKCASAGCDLKSRIAQEPRKSPGAQEEPGKAQPEEPGKSPGGAQQEPRRAEEPRKGEPAQAQNTITSTKIQAKAASPFKERVSRFRCEFTREGFAER